MKIVLISILVISFLFPTICAAGEYADKLTGLVDKIADFLYVIGFALAVIVIIVGGITYMTAGGNEEKIKKAKKIIVNGLIGAAIVLCAGIIIDSVKEIIDSI